VYLVNQLSLQVAQQIFLAADRFRTGQNLVGAKDGVNITYNTPGLEKFSHNLPFLDISIYFNGSRLVLLDDYLVSESGGAGTGFDTIVLLVPPPLPDDHLLADYLIEAVP
jgi:hypothetical protein